MARKLSRFQKLREDAQALLNENVLAQEGQPSRLRKFVHFWVLVWNSFSRNRCPVRASALAYGTLLALIPMLAVVMSITSTFLKKEGEASIDAFIEKMVASAVPPAMLNTNAPAGKGPGGSAGALAGSGDSSQPEATNNVSLAPGDNSFASLAQDKRAVAARREAARRIHDYIQNTRSGTLGVTGSVLLIFVAISMLSRIEMTFNDIWGVARGRSWFMRVVLYWGVISLAPILIIVAVGLASGPHFEGTKRLLTMMPFVGNLVYRFLPAVLLCLTFSAFYILMPNTRVDWRASLVGGVVAGLLFHLNNMVSVLYVSRVVTNSTLYGGLGLVPVFMIGTYFSWLILLFGAQVAYAFQNRATYLEEKQVENVNQRGREFIALRLLTCIGQRFHRGETAPTVVEMADELGVPTRLIRQVLQTLAAARLVVETSGPEAAYLPARPLESITCHDILLAMRATQGQELATRDEPARAEVYGEFQRIQEAERQAAVSVNMLDLVNRAQAQALSTGETRRIAD